MTAGQLFVCFVNRLTDSVTIFTKLFTDEELLVAKKKAQGTFVHSVLQNEGRCWTEFYRYVKRRKGNRENIPAIKDHKGTLFADPLENANSLNSYYAKVVTRKFNQHNQVNTSQLILVLTVTNSRTFQYLLQTH